MIVKGYFRHPVDPNQVFCDTDTHFVFTCLHLLPILHFYFLFFSTALVVDGVGDNEDDMWKEINLKVIESDPAVQKQLIEMKKKRKKTKRAERTRTAAGVGVGVVVGGVLGSVAGPLGTVAGMAVGGAVGAAAGNFANRMKQKKSMAE